MCFIPTLLGNAIGGRAGAIVGAGLGGGIPGALGASQIFKKKPATAAAQPTGATFG